MGKIEISVMFDITTIGFTFFQLFLLHKNREQRKWRTKRRDRRRKAGKEKKDSHPLMFQNRFWKLSEERVYGKKRFGTAEANINDIN